MTKHQRAKDFYVVFHCICEVSGEFGGTILSAIRTKKIIHWPCS